MSGFIDYELYDDLERLEGEGFFSDGMKLTQMNMRSISELKRLVRGMDDREVYTIIKAAVRYHFEMVQKTLYELQRQEGERNEDNQRV